LIIVLNNNNKAIDLLSKHEEATSKHLTKVLNEAKLRTKTYETAVNEKKELKIKLEVIKIFY
jgi:hypothetical protein